MVKTNKNINLCTLKKINNFFNSSAYLFFVYLLLFREEYQNALPFNTQHTSTHLHDWKGAVKRLKVLFYV